MTEPTNEGVCGVTPDRVALREVAQFALNIHGTGHGCARCQVFRDYLALTAPLLAKCGKCNGVGHICLHESQLSEAWGPCHACHGTGSVERADLAAIRKRAVAATPGPWNFTTDPFDNSREILTALVDGKDEQVLFPSTLRYLEMANNWEFIAHARTDIPALLDLIAAQAREIERLKGNAK